MGRKSMLAAGVVVACGALSVAPQAVADTAARIHDIQGTTRISPLNGQRVADVPGVVTGVRAFGSSRGFWIQDPQPDSDPRTSEGIFVFTGKETPTVVPGDAVSVSGEVKEYYPLADGETPESTSNQSITELTGVTWKPTGKAPIPGAESVGPDTVPDALAPGPGNIENQQLDPQRFALDYYESREGMNLRVQDARVVGPTDKYHALWLTTKPQQNANGRGGTTYGSYQDANSGRLKLESLIPFEQRPFPAANVGDQLRGVNEGPLDYGRFGGYVLEATALGEHVPGATKPETTRKQQDNELAVATYNVENLAANSDPAKFDRLAKGVAQNLSAPDVVTLEEVQDNSGPSDDGVVAADQTLRRLADGIAAAGGPRYEWREIDPQNNADGGQPGGNIRVAFLFNPARVSFVDRPGGDATTATDVTSQQGHAALTLSPGRIAPADPSWKDSRKPLAGEFNFHGQTVFIVANHLKSKGGDQPLHGRFQPPARPSDDQRMAQAKALSGFADKVKSVDQNAKVVALGDFNDFGFSPAVGEVTSHGLGDLAGQLPPVERYSYDYDGNSQGLDHILATGATGPAEYDIVHLNAEFADQSSDHDPQVARVRAAG